MRSTKIEKAIEVPNVGEVIFIADLNHFELENDGIGAYEFWGQKSYDAGTTYVAYKADKDFNWDKQAYTAEQNELIWAWLGEVSGGDYCPYNAICEEYAAEFYEMLAAQKEAYDLRNF